jgi:hypothetical protein
VLRVNVGLSRKLSRDYNSAGCSINLDGEISAPLDDAEGILEKIREFYDLAEEALKDRVENYEISFASPPGRDAQGGTRNETNPQPARDRSPAPRGPRRDGHPGSPEDSPPATNKQIQYLLTLGKRQGLTKPQLEQRVADIVGFQVDLYELTKRQAASVLDTLAGEGTARSRRN